MNVVSIFEESVHIGNIVQFEVGEGSISRSTRLGPLNANMTFGNDVESLPGLNTLIQCSLLDLNLIVESYDDTTVNSLEPITNLSLIHPKLIDYSIQTQSINLPTFHNDYTLACYLHAVESVSSSIRGHDANMTKIDVKYLILQSKKKKKKKVLMVKTTL